MLVRRDGDWRSGEGRNTGGYEFRVLRGAVAGGFFLSGAVPRVSTSRTARCGPACRMVGEGSDPQWSVPVPINPG
jgi:hypothetical protein